MFDVDFMRSNLLLSLVFIFIIIGQNSFGQRTLNFPKEKTFIKKLPEKENLWVFIMAGQSNMAGRGFVEPQDTVTNKRIITINKANEWVYAKEPLHFYEPSMTGLDSGLSFAKELLKYIPKNVTVAILPCAVGGSSIEQWLNDESHRGVKLLSNMGSKIALAQKVGNLKAVLWHQGESNANEKSIPSYGAKLKQLTDDFRQMAGNDNLPILMGQLGHYAIPAEKQKRWDRLNNVIEDYTLKDPDSYLILTDSLEHRGDHLHFNSSSQRELGKRFAHKYVENVLNAK